MSPKPHILHLVRHSPYQPISGARLRNRSIIRAMQELGNVSVFCVYTDSFTKHNACEQPGFYAHQVSFSAAKWFRSGMACVHKRSLLATDLLYEKHIEKRLHEIVRRTQPDIIILSEPWLFRYLEGLRQYGATIIFDMHNIESDLYTNICRASSIMSCQRLRNEYLRHTAHIVEPKCIAAADVLWTCSEHDAARAKEMAPSTPCYVVPNTVDMSFYRGVKALSATAEPPLHLLFCGTFSYAPNALAAKRILTNIFPRIAEVHPSVQLTLAGSAPTHTMLRAAKRDRRIHVPGAVPDIRPFLQRSGVVITPLNVGGGTRLKVLEAFAANRPVVATEKAAEGLEVTHGKHLLIGESDIALAHHAATLLSQPTLYKTITREAYLLTAKQYSDVAACEAIFDVLGSPLQPSSVVTAKSCT